MTRLPASVRIVEVGPRDGLQNEKAVVPLAAKVGLIDLLSATGLKTIEAGAFVSPKWVPQMADSAEVMARIARVSGVTYPVLVPNDTGLDAALAAGATEVAVFGAASESFSRRNINCSIAESLARFAPVVARALAAGLTVRGYVSCVLGCPYEGEVPAEKVAEVSAALFGLGCYEVSLGDTIGIGTPSKAVAMIDAVSARIPRDSLAVHFHDTYGMAVANIHAALDRGIAVVDSAVAGLGGCPYAKGATGNVATEDVLYLLDGLGIASGVAMDRLLDATRFISGVLDRPPASKVARALIARGGDSDA
ncbi:isopropylmalate/homocitrate/citramalate synthase [Inquilinus ginsengisoli]|uniref:Isopropylmalate/homocitrate/citramalate synthase n=1 Tax=Inquilinus ginsengisoli TaxID=363840 RepID=A0ABU1JVU5_9PROT|nr:hydroxymethylglutaryl-CoA lyase [Inquilinus ginsengisoli]MDR6292731.1 isopropylmalate/homocitrate/citramalate synthase [Inquilinus ginsengisoli]